MKAVKFGVGLSAYLLTGVALAGASNAVVVPLGVTLGAVLGSALPVVGSLTVAAVSLLVGIRIVRRKR
ncbi:MAG TPA: hypothetical protein VMM77_00520 [Gemmatimonadaceae bacterium]|nr:hypothetical protein [Gemmatimonadaceae bacterium]